jgi:hypothetical protein
MPTCFVIQPFDGGPFDKRYADVFAPALHEAGLAPYRVDEDPAVSVPIDAIEQGIRNATVCLADITTDNPNVWFELGFALACGKEVVLVCAKKERATKFPFDVQHRNIISYATEAPSDFQKLRENITKRVRATLKKGRDLEKLAASPLRAAEGLLAHEIFCLAVVAENTLTPFAVAMPTTIERDMQRAGFTTLATSLSLRGLLKKNMVETVEVDGGSFERDIGYRCTDRGQDWLMDNQEKLALRGAPEEPGGSDGSDIPF